MDGNSAPDVCVWNRTASPFGLAQMPPSHAWPPLLVTCPLCASDTEFALSMLSSYQSIAAPFPAVVLCEHQILPPTRTALKMRVSRLSIALLSRPDTCGGKVYGGTVMEY